MGNSNHLPHKVFYSRKTSFTVLSVVFEDHKSFLAKITVSFSGHSATRAINFRKTGFLTGSRITSFEFELFPKRNRIKKTADQILYLYYVSHQRMFCGIFDFYSGKNEYFFKPFSTDRLM